MVASPVKARIVIYTDEPSSCKASIDDLVGAADASNWFLSDAWNQDLYDALKTAEIVDESQ
jgi:hypothetical protein